MQCEPATSTKGGSLVLVAKFWHVPDGLIDLQIQMTGGDHWLHTTNSGSHVPQLKCRST